LRKKKTPESINILRSHQRKGFVNRAGRVTDGDFDMWTPLTWQTKDRVVHMSKSIMLNACSYSCAWWGAPIGAARANLHRNFRERDA
jgi:hypothetical protein